MGSHAAVPQTVGCEILLTQPLGKSVKGNGDRVDEDSEGEG